jgi:hypothetical protein
LDKFMAVVLIALGVWAGWFYLDDIQNGLAGVRRPLDPNDPRRERPRGRRAAEQREELASP